MPEAREQVGHQMLARNPWVSSRETVGYADSSARGQREAGGE